MKISITVGSKQNYHTEKLIDAAERHNVELLLHKIDFVDFSSIDTHPLFESDVVYWRINSAHPVVRHCFADLCKAKGIPFVNSSYSSFPNLGNKAFQVYKVEELGVPVPITIVSSSATSPQYEKVVSNLGTPFVLKPLSGKQGLGVSLINSWDEYSAYLNESGSKGLVCQQFLKNDGDYRVIVVGGKAIGVFKRIPAEGDFRANISQAGHGEVVKDQELKEELLHLAEKVSSFLKVEIAGIDFIVSSGNAFFLEINTIPQWQGFEQTTDIDVADEIIKYLISLKK